METPIPHISQDQFIRINTIQLENKYETFYLQEQ